MNERKAYPSDLTDAEWEILEPLIPEVSPNATIPTIPRHEIVNGIIYVLRSGCPWNLFRVTLVKKGLKGRLGEQRETLGERVESLGNPSTEEAEKSHASLATLWTASSAADFAGDDEVRPRSL